ncbi:MAG: hypothetical protein JWN32_2264 [Solirubrobacterales bacterium]|jgi:hypothetical protein|nr:hypothetical protein [Solirubrobacterales bacterium]
MGVLDEAIREHLALKRRRGANPEEVAREEHDALGPVRREPAEPEPPAAEPLADAELPAEAAIPPEPPASPPLVENVPEEPLTPAAPQPPEPGGEPTTEWDFDEEEPAGPAVKDDDVLEETPEFLQETPEHDKLWFEQKPPRDFDFDG